MVMQREINPKFIVKGKIENYDVEIRAWQNFIEILLINPDYNGHKVCKQISSIEGLTEQNCLHTISKFEGIVDYLIQARSVLSVQT